MIHGQYESDLKEINNDFNKINKRIINGQAHKLSSSDTYFLEASTTGEGHGKTTKQPFSDIGASPRRYALKTSYMNYVLANIVKERYELNEQLNFKECIRKNSNLDSILENLKKKKRKHKDALDENLSLDDLIFKKLSNFYNITDKKISDLLGLKYSSHYAFYPKFNKKDFNWKKSKNKKNSSLEIAEFVKANIEVKTVRIELDNKPEQHLSFPAFKFIDIHEQEFNESELYNHCNKRFLFNFFKRNLENELVFEKYILEYARKMILKNVKIFTI